MLISLEVPFQMGALSRSHLAAVLAPDRGHGADFHYQPARILVVEDDYFVSMEIEAALLEIGCDVVGMPSTAEDALVIAERERPDLVLMDIRLAGSMDGIEAAERIYAKFGIRSLFVTAHSDPGTHARGAAADPAGWVPKPFTSQQLLASLVEALQTIRRGS